MDGNFAASLVACLEGSSSTSLAQQANAASNKFVDKVSVLLRSGRIPVNGWSEADIERFFLTLSSMDSNNREGNVGVGEREGRIACPLVKRRSYGFAHGVGRSGNISEIQPKAAGSSILHGLSNRLVRHAFLIAGLYKGTVSRCLILPVATGMALTLSLLALRKDRPKATRVVWMRVDQKSCLKSITAAGLDVVVVENKLEGDEVLSDWELLENILNPENPDSILCVLSCSSCFAPRSPDKIVDIGRICKQFCIPHVVNNAYGLQSDKAVHLLNEVVRTGGRLDAFVQSTDKNFMVPVGGSIISGPNDSLLCNIESIYPGRASSSQLIDLTATLLYWGESGFRRLLTDRKKLFVDFREQLIQAGFSLLRTPHNDISMAIKLDDGIDANALGGSLFVKGVSGARAVAPCQIKIIDGIQLMRFGAHHPSYPHKYLTVATAIGMAKEDILRFIHALKKSIKRH